MFSLRAEDALTPTLIDGTTLNMCVEGHTVVLGLSLNSMHRLQTIVAQHYASFANNCIMAGTSCHNFHAFNDTDKVIAESCHSRQTSLPRPTSKGTHEHAGNVRLVGRAGAAEEDLSLVANSVMVSEGKKPHSVVGMGMGTAWT